MGLLKKVFLIVLLLFPLGELARLDFGSGIVVKPLDIGIGLLIILWLVIKLRKNDGIKQNDIFYPVLIFAAIGFFSLLINYSLLSLSQFFASSTYLIRWIVYAGVFFVVSDFDNDFKKRIRKVLFAVGSLIVGLGYFQYFFYSDAKNLLFVGWDEHMYRMFSVFFDPNFAGAFYVLFFLFIANKILKKKNIALELLLVLTLIAVFLTFSRSALIMLIVSSTMLFVLMNKKRMIAVLLAVIVFVLIISSRYFNIENINLFRIVSSEARLETAENAIKIIQRNPFLGVGFNAYRYAQIRYGFRHDKSLIASHADSGVDNSFLFVLATTGVIGFFSYLFIWYRILKKYWLVPVVVCSILGLFINSIFINSLFYSFIMLWMWVLLAVMEKK